MRLFKIIALCVISISVAFMCRAKPPDIVWRVDTRDHSDIFRNGFHSTGDNDDVVEHLSGRSCRSNDGDEGSSAFISTTSNRGFASNYAERVLRSMYEQGDVNAHIYIYQVRADDNMYSADYTLEFLLQGGHNDHSNPNGPDVLFRRNSEISRIMRYSPFLSEWMAYRRIEVNQIFSVTTYYMYQGSVRTDGFLPNPRFTQTRSSASVGPYFSAFTARPALHLVRTWMLRLGIRPMVSACFGNFEHTELKRDTHSHKLVKTNMFKLVVIL